ncbi:hypothetical protein BJL95_01195 [Methylomonas sp. LWB]|uniref:hypothetical protein n=1 Tax=Methylomonas sp. LWB TaxID=1905845 RepID=UPI0008D8E2FC|nr:hypothetical protein [Methylomonas sp. LWB]OHX35190.1 hypothetical protein BJL95_01195 [Methylomonas sp. LWB]
MMTVTLQAEPADFDAKVRQPGLDWLATQGIATNGPLPKKVKIPAYWSHSNKSLWEAYDGVCAYLAIYFEWVTGASSTDHFVAKSRDAGQAYEWSNYRLSCLGPNRNKNKYDDVLDPIGLAADTFVLNLVSGEISANRNLDKPAAALARKTIKRLKLDSPEHNRMRQRHYNQYLRHKDAQTLKELSPFVWYEAQRQGLL